MKKMLFAVVGLLLMAGCSDKKTDGGEATNPYLPIADLVIPREAVAGDKVTIQGIGFTDDCRVFLRLNGEATNTPSPIASYDDKSLSFTVPSSLNMGFYVVVLRKDGKYYNIGGINIRVNNYLEEDFEIYVLAGDKQEIYPASVSKQLKGTVLPNSSTLQIESYFGSVVSLSDGKIYYSGFKVLINPIRYEYQVSCYDSRAHTNESYGVISGLIAMGNINNELHILTTTDNKLYSLYKYEQGVQSFVKTFDLSAFGGQRLLENDMAFEYHAASGNILISGTIGAGENLAQATFALNLNTGVAVSNGDNGSFRYWFSVAGDKLYCFATQTIQEVSMTKALHITNPARWNLIGEGATLVSSIDRTMFVKPAYSPITGLIYALDDIETPGAVLMFNTATERFESKKWVNPGVASLFYAEPVVD